MASTAMEPNADPGGGVVAVEGDLGKECHALGLLFQQIVNELKVGFRTVYLPCWKFSRTGALISCLLVICTYHDNVTLSPVSDICCRYRD